MIKTIKKTDILVNPETLIWTAVCVAIGVIIQTCSPNRSFVTTLIAIGLPLVTYIFVVLVRFVPSYLKLAKIERLLGINFDQEMAERNVTKFKYKDHDWYISSRTVIMHRDFVVRSGTVEKIKHNDPDSMITSVEYEIPITGPDGKVMKIYDQTRHDFKKWLKED